MYSQVRSHKSPGVDAKTILKSGRRKDKIHVYSPYRGAISFYVYVVPIDLISCGLAKTFSKIPCKTILLSKKMKFQIHL